MPRVVSDADVYAAVNVGRFFTANNQTPADGNLTGQCVTLNKWFLAEMTEVPSAFMARGDARYVGDTLVRQGHAVEVPYSERRRGDFAVYKYGLYGHIGVVLSADRIFEQNVNVGGVARKLVDGAYVYAARIGSLNESWRPVRPNIYRINSYKEDNMPTLVNKEFARMLHSEMEGWNLQKTHNGEYDALFMAAWGGQPIENLLWQKWNNNGDFRASRERNRLFYEKFASIVDGLSARPTKEELARALAQISVEADKAVKAEEAAELARQKAAEAMAEAAKLREEKAQADKTGNLFLRWIGDLINKIAGAD